MPEGWELVKLSDIAVSELGKTLDKGKNSGTPRNYLCAFNVKWCSFDLSVIKKILLEDEELERYRVRKGDLLVCEGGDVGRAAIWESDQDIYYQNALHRVRFKDEISQYFYLYVLQYYKSLGMIDDVSGGVTIKHFTQNSMKKLSFPLPPIAEQKRIVSAIKQWFALIDTLETAKEDLQTSIAQAKSKILDLAIHGKLVPQDPNDEPTIELLKRINPKFTPCDNAHYENMPSNWTTILLGDLCFTINGLWKGKKPPFVNVGVVRNANFTKDCKLDYTNIAYLDVEVKQYEKRKLQCGDIIVEKSGGSDNQPVGRTILFGRKDGDYSFSNFTSVLRIYDGYPAIPEFLNMFLQSIYQTGVTKRMQTQTTGIHNLIFDQFLAIPVLLPPIAEQSRIIKKVNELFQILDNISANL